MEISWTDRAINELLRTVMEGRSILQTIKKMDWSHLA